MRENCLVIAIETRRVAPPMASVIATVRNGYLSHKDRCLLGPCTGQAAAALPNAAYVVGTGVTYTGQSSNKSKLNPKKYV